MTEITCYSEIFKTKVSLQKKPLPAPALTKQLTVLYHSLGIIFDSYKHANKLLFIPSLSSTD